MYKQYAEYKEDFYRKIHVWGRTIANPRDLVVGDLPKWLYPQESQHRNDRTRNRTIH
jgi:hypothetical protein